MVSHLEDATAAQVVQAVRAEFGARSLAMEAARAALL
jgi:hypothetical protein